MMEEVKRKEIMFMGMNLDEWSFGSCTANVGTGDGWATIYNIQSTEPGKGFIEIEF